jgi:hypothetical protein
MVDGAVMPMVQIIVKAAHNYRDRHPATVRLHRILRQRKLLPFQKGLDQ